MRRKSCSLNRDRNSAASSDHRGGASNSLSQNILRASPYSTIFCPELSGYAHAKAHEIIILRRSRKKCEVYPIGSSAHSAPSDARPSSNTLTSLLGQPSLEVDPRVSFFESANPTSGGVTVSTEMLAAKRHAGVHTPVIVGKMIIANQQMAYAA